MDTRHLGAWLFIGLAVFVGVALLFVRIDRDQLRQKVHTAPGLALYRFPIFRYGVACACFAMAALAFFELLQ